MLDLEGVWTRYDDPETVLAEIQALAPDVATKRMQELYSEPIKPELVTQRLAEIRAAGVPVAGALSPQRTQELYKTVVDAGVDMFVIRGTTVSAEHVSKAVEPLNLKKFIYELDVPVIVGGAATYTAALHLMRTGAAGVLVGFGGGAASTTRASLGIHAPMATAVADVAGARRDYLDESGGRYVHVIADGGLGNSGDIVKAISVGADAVMLGTALARATEAPGGGFHWGAEAHHPEAAARQPRRGRPARAAAGDPVRPVDRRGRTLQPHRRPAHDRWRRPGTPISRSSSASRSSSPPTRPSEPNVNDVSRSSKLGPAERAAAVEALRTKELDILVIGGGIVGTGAALDAVTRGLRVGLVEQRDWASGTSSRSSKLVHGGIRYLEQLDFRLVREALIERGLLLQRIAPAPRASPCGSSTRSTKPVIERVYIGAGMLLYDLFSWTGGRPPGVPHHRHLTKSQLMRAMPSLANDAFVGGLVYYDAQVDDARYVANLARTASFYGAHVASRTRVEGFVKEGQRVVGAKVHDLETGEHYEIRARQVVNATGVWTDDTQAMVGERGQFKVRASKGIHLVVPRDRFHSKLGLLLRTEKSVLFVIPWGRHWLIGTTDTDWDLDKAHPAATAADIDYMLEHVNSVLAVPLTRDDVEGVLRGAATVAGR